MLNRNYKLLLSLFTLGFGLLSSAKVADDELLILGSGASEGMPSMFCVCDFCQKVRVSDKKNERTRSSYMIGSKILIDWGPDALSQMRKNQVNAFDIQHVFITHSHEDHLFPMDFWIRGVSLLPANNLMYLYGNREVIELVGKMIGNQWEKFKIKPVTVELNKSYKLVDTDIEVTALAAKHTYPEQAMMYLFRSPKWSLLVTGDTEVFPDSSFESLKDANLTGIVIDSTWGLEDRLESHLGIPNILRIKSRLQSINGLSINAPIILSHLAPGKGAKLHDDLSDIVKKDNLIVAFDGMKIQLNK